MSFYPPPRRQGTLDDLSEMFPPSMAESSMNDIDGDDDDTEADASEISDNDSILAMAKRLDASSVISDPSLIEGSDPSHGSGGARLGPGATYARDRGGMDSVSEGSSDSESDGSSGSESSFERNPRRAVQGQPHVGFQGGYHYNQSGGGHQQSYQGRYPPDRGQPELNPNRGRQQQQQQLHQQQQHYNGHYAPHQGPPELNPNRYYASDPGPPEPNPHRGQQGGVRFAERGRRRTYNPHEQPGGYDHNHNNRPPSPVGSIEGPPHREGKYRTGRSRSRSRSPGRRSAKDRETELREKKRRVKLMLIPILVLVGIAIAVGVAVAVGNLTKEEDVVDDETSQNLDVVYQSLPTAAPTYQGLYKCVYGRSGPVAVKGCLGYVQCNAAGMMLGDIVLCPSGTLYDEDLEVCNHFDLIDCPTNLPPLDSLQNGGYSPPAAQINDPPPAVAPPPPSAPRPTPAPVISTPPPIVTNVETVQEQTVLSVGPTATYDHRLAFVGVSTPGDVTAFQQNLQTYLSLFYSPVNIELMDADDPFRSLEDVSVAVTVTGVENRRRLSKKLDDATANRSIRGNDDRRDLQGLTLGQVSNNGDAEPTPWFVATYIQVTSYRTTDPSITVGAIVRRPFDPEHSDQLVEILQRRDPDAFSGLESIELVEGDEFDEFGEGDELGGEGDGGYDDGVPSWGDGPPSFETSGGDEREPTGNPTAWPPADTPAPIQTRSPTRRPSPARTLRPTRTPRPTPGRTARPTPNPTPDPTPNPTPNPTPRPTPSPTPAPEASLVFVEFPVRLTIQGLAWLDEDRNGLYDSGESPMEGLFVNLRSCYKDTWRATTTTNAIGQYQFVGVEEGEYYVDFFKPNPADQYEFTLPRVGGADDRSIDSDVVYLDGNNGKSECMAAYDGFARLTNAGYVEAVAETDAPTPRPTPRPTPFPTSRPTTAAPVMPRFCAYVDEVTNEFDFEGCTRRCVFKHEECPDGMRCALTDAC